MDYDFCGLVQRLLMSLCVHACTATLTTAIQIQNELGCTQTLTRSDCFEEPVALPGNCKC